MEGKMITPQINTTIMYLEITAFGHIPRNFFKFELQALEQAKQETQKRRIIAFMIEMQ